MSAAGEQGGGARPELLLWGCVALGVLHAASFLGAGPCDDDYVVYRYAANLVAGHGPVFHPGERAEGYTVPLWMLLLAAGLKAGLAAEVVSRVVSVASVGVAVWAVGSAWRRRSGAGPGTVPWPALLVAASPALAYHAALGLGTATLAALLAAWLALDERARLARGTTSRAAALLLGLACVLRPEALLFAVPYFLFEVRGPRSARLLALLPFVAWQAFRVSYYDAWLPISYGAKKLPLLADLAYGLAYLGRTTLECGVGLLLALALALPFLRPPGTGGARVDGEGNGLGATERTALVGATLYALFVVYAGGDYIPLSRFYVPLLPVLVLLACRAARAWSARAGRPQAATLLFALLLLASQWPQVRRPALFHRHADGEERWIAIGRTLAWLAPPGTKVAASPVGAIGYFSGLQVVDLLGITHPAFLDLEPDLAIEMKGHHRHDAEWALAQQPDVVILGNGILDPDAPEVVVSAWERDLFEHPRFRAEYAPRAVDVEGSYPLIYWQRLASPLLPGAWELGESR